MKIFDKKPKDELEKMSTKNLLAYYRAERKRMLVKKHLQKQYNGIEDDDKNIRDISHELEKMEGYLWEIKTMLNGRENVAKK